MITFGLKKRFHFKFILLVILFAIVLFPKESSELDLNKKREDKPKKQYAYHKLTKVESFDENGDDETGDDEDYKFEKIHKASVSIHKTNVEEHKEQNEPEEEGEEEVASLNIFDWFFGSKKKEDDKSDDDDTEKSEDEKSEPEPNNNGNGIINWLKSLKISGEESERAAPLSEVLIEYVDRWPFNAIFPIGKPERFAVPKRRFHGYNNNADPISDEHFVSLLDSFPTFVIDPNYVSDIDCKQQLQILQRQLRGHKVWSMQMLDSSGKIPSGILRGNINQFGEFDLCTQIKTIVKVTHDLSIRIKGKYCLAHIEIQSENPELKVPVYLANGRGLWNSHLGDPSHFAPRYSIVNWGICLPNSCPASVVQQVIDENLKPYNHTGINFHVEVDEQDCFIRSSKPFRHLLKNNNNIGMTVGYFIIFLSFVITACLIENNKFFKFLFKKYIKPVMLSIMKEIQNTASKVKNSQEKSKKKNEETKTVETEESNAKEEPPTEEEPPVEEEPVVEKELQTEEEEEIVEEETSEAPTDPSLFRDIILSFSPNRSIRELLSSDSPDTRQFAIFHILKILCTFGLYVCLKYLMIGHLPIIDRDKLVKSLDTPTSILFRSPLIYLDILLIISGFIKSHQLCIEMEEKSHINVLKRMTAKILRYLPTLYAILLFQTWILPHLGSGPLWSNLIGRNSQLCEQNMWRNLFGVQNVINMEETCSPMTIQLSVELQLYLLAPLIVWLFYCNSEVGFFVYGGIHAMSVAGRYSRTNMEQLSSTIFHGIHVSKFYRTANLLYSSPITRATPFLIGIGAGILHKTSGNEWKDMSRVGLISGWITSILSILYCFLYPLNSIYTDYVYNAVDAASYSSWSSLLLGLGIGWIIFMLPTHKILIQNDDTIVETTPIHNILIMKPILLLSRISYPMQLIMYVVVMYNTANVKEAERYTIADLINLTEIAGIIVYSIIIAILIDVPIQNVRKLLLDKLLPDKPVSNTGTEEIAEHGDHVESEEEHEEIEELEKLEEVDEEGLEVHEKEKVTDDIWGTNPDEEKRIFLAKQNSLTGTINGTVQDLNKSDQNTINWEKENDVNTTEDNEEEEEEEEAEGEEEEEEEEISEKEEVKKSPKNEEEEKPKTPPPPPITYRRRRFNE